MSAPTVTARGAVSGYKLPDGFSSRIAFSLKPSVTLWEKSLKPPGIDGGEPIDQSTMLNTLWHTFRARQLKKLDSMTFMAAYDPDVVPDLISLVNNDNGSVTVHWPDGSAWAAWGYLQKLEWGELKEGEMPEVTATIAITNYDPVGQVEAGPVFQAASGT